MSDRKEGRSGIYRAYGAAFNLVAAVAGFVIVGWWVGQYFFQRPQAGVLVGLVLGFIGGFYNFFREALAAGRAAERDYRERAGHSDEERRE